MLSIPVNIAKTEICPDLTAVTPDHRDIRNEHLRLLGPKRIKNDVE
jgi:hypothetical protein